VVGGTVEEPPAFQHLPSPTTITSLPDRLRFASEPHRLPPRRWRTHGALQLALRQALRRPVPAAYRGPDKARSHDEARARSSRGSSGSASLDEEVRPSGRESRAPSARRPTAAREGTAYRLASARPRRWSNAARKPSRVRKSFARRRCDPCRREEVKRRRGGRRAVRDSLRAKRQHSGPTSSRRHHVSNKESTIS